MKLYFLPLVLLLSLSACVYGPVLDKKAPHHALSGEHYQSTGSIAGVPILQTKERDTVVRGKVIVEDPLAVLPSDLQVQLWREGNLMSEARAARTGDFELVGNFPDGAYLVKVVSKRYDGEGELRISGFRVEDVTLSAKRRKTPQ